MNDVSLRIEQTTIDIIKGFYCDECKLECEECVWNVAIKSVEKRLPKKPFNTDGYVDDKKIGIHYCDSCGHFVFYSDRFCNKCGQYQDWGDEE